MELLKKFLVYPSKQRISAAEVICAIALIYRIIIDCVSFGAPLFFVWPLRHITQNNRQLHHRAAAHKDFNVNIYNIH